MNGSKGSLVFNFEEMNVLQFYNCADPPGRQGFRSIMATEGVHPYVGAVAAGACVGIRAHVRTCGVRIDGRDRRKKTIMADFHDGAQCVAVLDAVEQSIDEGKWAKVEMVK